MKARNAKVPEQKVSSPEGIRNWDWPYVLDEHPEWAESCPWKALDSERWPALLGRHPEYWEHCPEEMRSCLDDWDWAGILADAPSLARHCDFAKFHGSAWSRLLCSRPEFAGKCDFAAFDGSDWCMLLSARPEFATRCDFGKLTGSDWRCLLCNRPEFAKKCDFSRLNPLDWASLVRSRPEFADRCGTSRLEALWKEGAFAPLSGRDWCQLLAVLPGAAEWCDFSLFDAWHWADLLSVRPELADKCDFSRLDALAWELLLACRPQFADRCDWKALPAATQAAILARHPDLAGHCTVRRFSPGRMDTIVVGSAKDARALELGLAALPDDGGPVPELPAEQFFDWARRKELERAALREYEAWLAGANAPKFLSRYVGKLIPQVQSTCFSVRIESGRWQGLGYCRTACPGVYRWGKSYHQSPGIGAAGGSIPGAVPPESRFGPLVERYGKALSPAAWETVLAEDPGLAPRCPAGTLGNGAVARLLARRPELALRSGRTPPPDTPDSPPDGFPALEFIRWAKRHDIVRRTLFAWMHRMRSVRDEEPAYFVRWKCADFHPRAVAIGMGRGAFHLAYCHLDLINSRGRRTGWFEGLFWPDGEYYDATWNLKAKEE